MNKTKHDGHNLFRALETALATKGRLSILKRFFLLTSRHGFGTTKMHDKLSNYIRTSKKSTLTVTARVLEKHPRIFQKGADYAVHGFRHSDYSRMTSKTQELHLEKALKIFRRFDGEEIGFRAPYLKTNPYTLQLLKKLSFLYDSSCSIYWAS